MATLAICATLIADDVTVVGVVDDPAVPFIFVGGMAIAGTLYVTTSTTKTTTRTIPMVRSRPRVMRNPLIYVTYTKPHPVTGRVYAGRARGFGMPEGIVEGRDARHDMDEYGYGAATLDKWAVATLPWATRWADPSYQAIRGREQQLIDSFGGALSDTHDPGMTRSGNKIRGVARTNPRGRAYHDASNLFFGPLAPFWRDVE